MKTLYQLWALARADFLERRRRPSYLLTLGFTVYLAFAVNSGKIVLRMNEYRGTPDLVWFATSMQLVCIVFMSLFGFYIVKNGIQRDEETRVGRILAATPLPKPLYTLGKASSNFLVLASMVLVLACAAIVMPLLQEQTAIDYRILLFPFLLAALPCIAVVGALAVLFESLSFLRGTAGNVLYFFVWIGLLSLAVLSGTAWVDFSGVGLFFQTTNAALQAVAPGYVHGLQINPGDVAAPRLFPWHGIQWTPAMATQHLFWIPVSGGIACLAAVFFPRFDPARETAGAKSAASGPALIPADTQPILVAASAHLTPLSAGVRKGSFAVLLVSELKLMLKGTSRWWYLVAAGLLVGSVVAPLAASRVVLVAAWIWPLLLWSQMGTRESCFGTHGLIFSCPLFRWRQLPAAWLAGVIVTAVTGIGTLLRTLLAGDLLAVLSWLAAVLVIPALALALGIWTGGTKTFEVVYLLWWYAGPLNHVSALDFMGISPGSGRPLRYASLAAGLLAVSFLGRRVRMRLV